MRRLLLAAGAVAILVAISGCDAADPRVTPAPTPRATPVFASDEEALAAAEAAYAAYTEVEDAIARDGGAQPERLVPLTTPDWYKHELAAFKAFEESGRRQVGSTLIGEVVLQQYSQSRDGAEVVVYVCVDFSGTSFVDSSGNPVTVDAPRQLTVEAAFESSPTGLLLSRSEPWSASIC